MSPSSRALWGKLVNGLAALALTLASCPVCIAGSTAAPPPVQKQAPLYEDARQKFLVQDYQSAIGRLHEILQDDQQYLPARILLGQCYLHSGQPAGAEIEFRVALSLGADKFEVLTPLANALLLQRKYKEILELTQDGEFTPTNQFEVQVLRGRAYYELGELDNAESEFKSALESAPKQLDAVLGMASVATAQGHQQEAQDFLDQAVEIAPNDPESWFQRGNLGKSSGDFSQALESLSRALELNPNHMRARLVRGNVYVGLAEYAKAKDDAVIVHAKRPHDPEAALLLWQTEVLLGDQAGAKAASEDAFGILKTLQDAQLLKQPSLLRTAALVSMARRDYALAGKYLRQFVELKPNDLYMRKMYGRAQLQLGDPNGAVSTFRALSKVLPQDWEVFAELGRSHLMLQQYAEADAALQQAVQLAPEEKALIAPMALSKIGMGLPDAAMAELASSEQKDLSTPEGGGLYALMQMKRGDLTGSRATLDGLLKKHPRDAFLLNLSGNVYLKSGAYPEARKNFSSLLADNPQYLSAAYNLSQLDFRESGPAAAIERLQGILRQNSKFVPAMELLADIAIYQGRLAESLLWLEKARVIEPPGPDAERKLIDLYVALNRKNEAFLAARSYADAHPNSPAAAMLLARVQVATGDNGKAKDSYRKAMRIAITDGDALLDIAREQIALNDLEGARRSLALAAVAGRADAAQPALVRIEIATRNFSEAKKLIEGIEQHKVSPALVQLLRGELHRKDGKLKEAIAAFEEAFAQAPGTDSILGLYEALIADGQRIEAFNRLEAWTVKHPGDLAAGRTLALGYVYFGDLDKARALHEKLLTRIPDDSLLLANLARIYQLQKRPDARKTAQRALQIEPQSAIALDTLGWIVATEGDLEGGLKYLRDAIAREATPLTRFHLASVLHELQRNDEAKIELNRILSDQKGPLRAEAQRLYDTIAERDPAAPAAH